MQEKKYPIVNISTSLGDMTAELWNDVAPNHVQNFLKLVSDGFYDNLLFHRVIPNFVAQGGCPNGNGTGGPGWTVDAEFNDRPHKEGVLSMARGADPNSAGSQFFLCLEENNCKHLDGNYTAFGKVISGNDVLGLFKKCKVNKNDSPIEPVLIISIKDVTG